MIELFSSPEHYLQRSNKTGQGAAEVAKSVHSIIEHVRSEGDAALLALTERFDKVRPEALRVPRSGVQAAIDELGTETRQVLESTIDSVRRFHLRQRPESWMESEADGSKFGMRFTAIENIGIYVPGGTAGYPSTVIMAVVPAQLAGASRIALTTPPGQDGRVNKYVLAVAGLLGVGEVYAVGGAQAIAALAFGTQTVAAVDKIVGPGNTYVNEAKRQVFGTVGIDALAGPTELVVLADESANQDFIARDLAAQAEHDVDARATCVTTSKRLAVELQQTMIRLLPQLDRKEILSKAYISIVQVAELQDGVALVNRIAPEHLQIMTRHASKVSQEIRHAGAIFIGAATPAVVGDYGAGPNHILPTNATARFSSPLSVMDFMKFSSVLELSPGRLRHDAARLMHFAELEGFSNHGEAVAARSK